MTGRPGTRPRTAPVVTVSQPKVGFKKLTQGVAHLNSGGVLKEETEPLPATTRRERMLQLIAEREFVRVADLAGAFGISEVTARADLAALAASHAVRRVRGGAMAPARDGGVERSFEESAVVFAGEKRRIAEHAAAMVGAGTSVLLDVGTTTTAVARALVARTDLEGVVVTTNGLNIALELEAAIGRITVVLTGGTLRRLQHSLVDPYASEHLRRMDGADLAFVGCNGVDAECGVTNLVAAEAEVKRQMVAAARRVVVLADGSKLGQVHENHVATAAEVDTVVTGPSAPEHELQRLRRGGTTVVQVT